MGNTCGYQQWAWPSLHKHDASDGTFVDAFNIGRVSEEGGIAFDGTNLWVVGMVTQLLKVRPSDG